MKITSEFLGFLHDARLLGVKVDFSRSTRCLEFTIQCYDNCGEASIAGKTLILRTEDMTILQSRVFGAMVALETIDSCDLSVSHATCALIRDWVKSGGRVPKVEFSLTTHSGSNWEIVCESVSLEVKEV